MLTSPQPIKLSPKEAEQLVASLLKQRGWQILAQNYRGVGFELDLVTCKGNTLAIVEVKYRPKTRPEHAVREEDLLPWRKSQALLRGTQKFIYKHQITAKTVRVDLAVVSARQVSYFPNVIHNNLHDF